MTRKIDATRPFYAVVGAGDLAVEFARHATADVQARFAKIELEPKALREQARTVVTERIDELTEDAKEARERVEARAKEARERAEARAKEAREHAEARAKEARSNVDKARAQIEEYFEDAVETYDELAARGRKLVARIRGQEATKEMKHAAEVTVVKADTARTQTAKSAKRTAATAKRATKSTAESAKKTAGTARTNVKATSTAAKKTAKASGKAAVDAAEKVGD